MLNGAYTVLRVDKDKVVSFVSILIAGKLVPLRKHLLIHCNHPPHSLSLSNLVGFSYESITRCIDGSSIISWTMSWNFSSKRQELLDRLCICIFETYSVRTMVPNIPIVCARLSILRSLN